MGDSLPLVIEDNTSTIVTSTKFIGEAVDFYTHVTAKQLLYHLDANCGGPPLVISFLDTSSSELDIFPIAK